MAPDAVMPTVEMVLESVEGEPRRPAVPLRQSSTPTSFEIETCSCEATERRSEAAGGGDALLQEKNAENGDTSCKINKNPDTLRTDVGNANIAEDRTSKYLCRTCYTQWDTKLSYCHHMTTEHSVAFFYGHCLKPYKRTRYLLTHVGYHHQGLPFLVFKFEDRKFIDVSKLVAPSWVCEAQNHLKRTNRAKLQKRGKTMIKKSENCHS